MEENFEQNIPFVPVVIGFLILLFSTNFLQRKMRERALRKQGQVFLDKGEIPPIEVRIAANKEWKSGRIKSTGGFLAIVLCILAIVWNLCFGVGFIKSFSNPDIKTGGLIALGIFASLGIIPIYFAIRETIRHFRYGASICIIEGKAAVLGKVMKGIVTTNNDIQATGDYVIEVQCLESYESRDGNTSKSTLRQRWFGRQVVPALGIKSSSGIPFSMELPSTYPETAYQLSTGKISWQLAVKAPTKGVDFSAVFVIPVFKME